MWYVIYSWAHSCKAINEKCSNCKKIGHFAKVCQQREINNIEINVNDTTEEVTETYQLYSWNFETTQNAPKFLTTLKNDFMRQVSINNNIVQILIDTGAKVSVCGVKQAKLWGHLIDYNLQKPKHTLGIRHQFQ